MGVALRERMVVQTKVVIVGDGAIGKSCLVEAIKDPDKEMSTDYVPTIAENTTIPSEYEGRQLRLDFWDTAGQEQFKQLRKSSYSHADVVVLGFCLKDKETLESIVDSTAGWVTEFRNNVKGFENWILCGTQKDLWDPNNKEHCQESRIWDVAEEIGAKEVIYTSAFTKEGCQKCQDYCCKMGICVEDSNPISNWERPAPETAPAEAEGDKGKPPTPKNGNTDGPPDKRDPEGKEGGCNCTLL